MIQGLLTRGRLFLGGRGVRKLLRDRMAVAALMVIACYCVVAVAVGVFGLLDEEDFTQRVGANTVNGFGMLPDAEKRYQEVQFWLENSISWAERLERAEDPAAVAQDLHFAEVRPISTDPAELVRLAEACQVQLDDLNQYTDLGASPAAMAALEQVEASVRGLYRWPTGWDAFLYRARLLLGTDRQGRSILVRGLYSVKVAIQIGVVSALIAVAFGTLLGGLAGYFGGMVDHGVVWLYSTFSSIPWIVLLMVLAATFTGGRFDGTLVPVYAAFCVSFWISPCRVVRGEVMKLKELEYVQAAAAAGFGRTRILLRHVIPNTAHLMFINFSLLFIGAIKAEVILSFLNLGVKGEPSWGVMINHAKPEVLNGFFWQIGTATFLMVGLVLAFNVLSDALQDAFDPKHVG